MYDHTNSSPSRFRRALIGHYIVGEAEMVSKFFHPVLRMDGSEMPLGVSDKGDRCGRWAEEDGTPIVEFEAIVDSQGSIALAERLEQTAA